MLYLLIFIGVISFFGAHVLNTWSVIIRVNDSVTSGAFVSHSREQMLRFCSGNLSLLFALICSILIEQNYGVAIFIAISTFSSILIFLFLFFAYLDVFIGEKFFSFLFNTHKSNIKKKVRKNTYKQSYNPNLITHSFISFSFLLLGYVVAFGLAHLYPDYRLTMFQIAALIHGLGTFFSVFYVNRLISIEMKNYNNNSYGNNINTLKSFVLGRLISVTLVMLFLVASSLYIIIY